MFSTCIHCHSPLGRNELIEHFPVGRRLAFDAAKGRLWVICLKCKRWNLTPLEERWEAIEECERQYSSSRLRASTDNIALARLADGSDVVRIGAPKAPEMAAWRYMRDFRRRWLTNGIPLAFVAGGGAQSIQYAASGSTNFAMLLAPFAVIVAGATFRHARTRGWAALPTGEVVSMKGLLRRGPRIEPRGNSWGIRLGASSDAPAFGGDQAVPTLRAVMAARNLAGAPSRAVNDAVQHLQDAGHPERFITRLARATERTGIQDYPPAISMALEMALHEDSERRALEGELELLRDEWQLAEEVAHISDNMFLPDSVV
ncbi:MAG TPA: hypothetical protein VE967_18395, partial [Gemmatimonadaceae bacterium]|nr:hypothetical protein [Gemmatimonadaceae bacterium]